MSLLTEVTGECYPFSDAWLDQLDKMSKKDALLWVTRHIEQTLKMRDHYEKKIVDGPEYIHAYCIECNNIIRYELLYKEISEE